jgi:hypothetical protein
MVRFAQLLGGDHVQACMGAPLETRREFHCHKPRGTILSLLKAMSGCLKW